MPDEKKFSDHLSFLEAKHRRWEELCCRCGGCCGAYEDPCKHLVQDGKNTYKCTIYDRRFGNHHTVKGEEFRCVHITEVWNGRWKNDHLCIYKQKRKFGPLMADE